MCCLGLLPGALLAQGLPAGAVNPAAQEQLQRQREAQQRQAMEREPDVRLQGSESDAPSLARQRLGEVETPCFQIQRVELLGLEGLGELERFLRPALKGPEGDDAPEGHCLGVRGVSILLSRLQDALIAQGYITTRVLTPAQDLSAGLLQLHVVPGRLHQIRVREGSSPQLRLGNALPTRPGDLLNLRDMEQALENLQRVPGAQADIQVEPAQLSSEPGLSDLAVSYQGGRGWRLQFALDDGGSESTGRHALGLTTSLDHLLTLNDLFYLTLNRDAGHLRRALHRESGPASGNDGHVLHYSLPWGYSLLSFTFSRSGYRQVVIGANQDYVYRGSSRNGEIKLNTLLWRDARHKFGVWVKLFGRGSRNYIDDTEVEVQRRRVGGWEAGLNLKRSGAQGASSELNLSLRRGTGAFSAMAAPEEEFGEGSSRMALLQGDLSLNWPVQLGERKLQLSSQWRGQLAQRPLVAQDRFAIGGRYTVRGFGSDSSLSADSGLLWRTEAELPLTSLVSGYLGVDSGWVGGGPAVERLAGRHLAGAVLGARLRWQGLYLDVFAGAPLRQPERFPAARLVAGFNLSYSL
ncbi:ShlB/FhaC/HecB family hemolysin secretion/activation protein [Roseateles sp. DAIF2]|uniref:ShlB/FhaC/HecB family hemolysin secretion/activation protein n=1 Tax=Roseateles sp. DAIF2 TaxID=2714952 RepID=UPI00201D9638|nr:ShlB/FhaC/HecB family hemolysin secretion/activation protein [Roseateles sp. DAIF2]